MGGRDSCAEGCTNKSNGELRDAYGGGAPCPVMFDAEDVCETTKPDEGQREADEILKACHNIVGFGLEGWVPTED